MAQIISKKLYKVSEKKLVVNAELQPAFYIDRIMSCPENGSHNQAFSYYSLLTYHLSGISSLMGNEVMKQQKQITRENLEFLVQQAQELNLGYE